MNLPTSAATGARRLAGRRILDGERTGIVISRLDGSTPDRTVDVAPLLRRSIATVVAALITKIAAAAVIATSLGVRPRMQRLWFLPVLAYDTGARTFSMITSRSTLAMSTLLVVAFLAVLLRHSRQQCIAGSAVGVLGATNALLVDLLLQHRWGGYVEFSTVRWNLLLLGVGWLLMLAWLALDRLWQALRATRDATSTPTDPRIDGADIALR